MSIIEKAIDRLVEEDSHKKRAAGPETLTASGSDNSMDSDASAVSAVAAEAAEPLPKPSSRLDFPPEADAGSPALRASPGQIQSSIDDAREAETRTQVSTPPDVIRIYDAGLEGIISQTTEGSRTAEEFRMIKRPLLQRAFGNMQYAGEHPNLVVVTSSVAGEGKTFTALNLAVSIAMELDRTVLLADADLANPGLSRLLRVRDRPGLTERLLDERLDLKDLLLRTNVPKLTLLPAGRRHLRSTELLASSVMRSLLDELANRYPDRIVLFDSPPLLATTEASVLANQAGQICLVVESGATPQFLVKEAVAMLQHPDRASLVLNKAKRDLLMGQDSYYGYRYAYGYGYGKGREGANIPG